MNNKDAAKIFQQLIDSITIQLKIANDKISNLEITIKKETEEMQVVMAELVQIMDQHDQQEKNVNQMESNIESIKSEINDLNQSITEMNNEIEECKRKIHDQCPNEAWNIINHILNPLGAFINDIVRACVNTIHELTDKINNDNREISNCNFKLNTLNLQLGSFKAILAVFKDQVDTSTQKACVKEQNIQKLGRDKTANGNLQVQLGALRTRLKISLDNSKQGAELLEIDINVVSDSIKELTNIYQAYDINCDLFKQLDLGQAIKLSNYSIGIFIPTQ